MSDIWIAVVVGVVVPVVVLLGPYAWMLLPWHWERRHSAENVQAMARQHGEWIAEGIAAGIKTARVGQ